MTTLADQPRDAAGIDPVQEPMYDYGSNSDDTVTERHRAVAAPAAVAARNSTLVPSSPPGASGGVGQGPTLILGRAGVSVGEGVTSTQFSRSVGTPGDKENVMPPVQKSLSQFDNADDEYFYDDYAVCSDMLHDRNVNMLHRVIPRYALSRAQVVSPDMREI